MHLGGGDVEVVAEMGVHFRRGFVFISDALAHNLFQQLLVLMVFKRGEVRGWGQDEIRKSSITIREDRAEHTEGIFRSCPHMTLTCSRFSSTQQQLLEDFSGGHYFISEVSNILAYGVPKLGRRDIHLGV